MSEKNRSHHSPTFLEETRSPLVRLCHRAIFALLLLILIVAPLLAGHTRPWIENLLMLAIAAAAGFWIVRVLVVREAQVVFSQLGAAFLTLGSYALVRYSLADLEPVARPGMLLALSSTLLFFLVLNDLRHRWQITVLVWTLTGLGTLLALLALGQLFFGARPTATFARPVDLAVYLLLVLPVVAANFLFSRRSVRQKVGLAFAGLVICAGFVVTRAYWHWLGGLAAFLVVALFVIQKRGWRFRWLVIGSCIIAVVLVAMLLANFGLRPSNSGWSDFERADLLPGAAPVLNDSPPLWRSVLALSQRHLWLGAGPGMIEWLYPGQRGLQASVRRSGSEYCNVFVEGGLIGSALVLWVLITFVVVVQIVRLRAGRYTVAQQSNRFAFAVAGLAAITAVIVNGAVDLNLRVTGNTYTLAIIMSAVLTCGVHRRADEEEPEQQPGRYITLRMRGANRFVLAAALMVLVLLLLAPLLRSLPSAWLLRTGHQAIERLDWAAAERAYSRAWNFDSRNYEVALAAGDLYNAQATWNARQRESLGAKALAWYSRARTLNPFAYDVLIRIARIHDLLGEHDKAFAAYTEALQNDPRNASYHAQLGWHYQRREDHELAQKSFRTARQLGAVEVLPAAGS